MSEKAKTARQLDSSGGETPDLRGVIGADSDAEDVDLFGYQIIYTTGDFQIPRDDLLEKMSEVGLPEWMAPSKVAPHRAFGRMMDDLADDGEEVEFQGERVRFTFDSGESRYAQHVHAKVFHSAEEDTVKGEEGKWVDWELGVIEYDSDISGLHFIDRIDEDSALRPLWEGMKGRAQDRFDTHQDLHTGKDINTMTYYLTNHWTDSVKLRDSCYFVPAFYDGIEEYIDGFRALYEWIDRNYKTSGQHTELYAVEIVDTERQREMVEDKVRDNVEDELDSVFHDVVEEVKEGESADEIAEEVTEELERIGGIADDHSTILKTELSVKRAVKDVLEGMEDDRSDVVDRVLEETGFGGDD
jgi:hypothetical protein